MCRGPRRRQRAQPTPGRGALRLRALPRPQPEPRRPSPAAGAGIAGLRPGEVARPAARPRPSLRLFAHTARTHISSRYPGFRFADSGPESRARGELGGAATGPPREPLGRGRGTALSGSPAPCVVCPCAPGCLHDHHVLAHERLCVSEAVSTPARGRTRRGKVRRNPAQMRRGGVGVAGRNDSQLRRKEALASCSLQPPPVLHKHEPRGAAARPKIPPRPARTSAVTAQQRCRRPRSVPWAQQPFPPAATSRLHRLQVAGPAAQRG